MERFHIDPINLLVLLGAMYAAWRAHTQTALRLEADSKWHGAWIKKHDAECDQRERTYLELFKQLQLNTAQLMEIARSNAQRIDRLEHQIDGMKR